MKEEEPLVDRSGVEVLLALVGRKSWTIRGHGGSRSPSGARSHELVGERAESLAYTCMGVANGAGSTRGWATMRPGRSSSGTVSPERHTPAATDLRAFVEISAANELDVLAHDEELAAGYGARLYRLFGRARGLLSEPAWRACRRQLAGHAAAGAD